MRVAITLATGAALLATLGPAEAPAQQAKATPYWVSIAASRARTRTGPAVTYPAMWEYVRPGLPLKVVQVRNEWRKVEDPDGEQGWMKGILLSEQRTAIVTGEIRPMRQAPDRMARISWRAAPGVVGKVAHCKAGWCEFEVRGRAGYIEIAHVWGVEPDEEID